MMEIQQTKDMQFLQYNEADFTWHTQSWMDNTHSELSKFDSDLRKRWDSAMANGMFRYDVDHIVTRILPGPKRYVCQLNTKRNVIRRQPQAVTTVKEPFNYATFNFTKVGKNEILFDLRKHSCPEKSQTCSKAHTRGKVVRQNSNVDNEVATMHDKEVGVRQNIGYKEAIVSGCCVV